MLLSPNHRRPLHHLTRHLAPLFVVSLCLCSCAEFDPALIEGVLGAGTGTGTGTAGQPVNEREVGLGLREALRVGTARAVERLAVNDGYWGNELVRIQLPEQLDDMANTLRRVGFGKQVDDLEIAMNRAAEQAATEAIDVFSNAVSSMSIADAWSILRGHETAATDYFRDRTGPVLADRFQPVIEKHMDQIGLYRSYERLAGTYNALPFVTEPAVDLDTYLTDKALDGLFHELAKEEKKIRADPISRTTELLKRVFAAR